MVSASGGCGDLDGGAVEYGVGSQSEATGERDLTVRRPGPTGNGR